MASENQPHLFEDVIVRLAELIRKGSLKPGDRLPAERKLAAMMNISRATLREALRVMQLRGFIVSKRGAGSYISGGTPEDLALALDHLALQDIFELRLLIEPSIAALAALRATPDDVSRLEAILAKQERQIAQRKNIADTDAEYHKMLAEATQNRALVEIGATLMHVIAPSRTKYLQTPERACSSLDSHRSVFEAVRSRDPTRARSEMEKHIYSIDRALFSSLKESVAVPNSKIPSQQEVIA